MVLAFIASLKSIPVRCKHGGFANVNVNLTFFLSTSMFLNRTLNSISQMLSLETEHVLHGRSCGEP